MEGCEECPHSRRKRGVRFAWGCCLQEGAAGEESLEWPSPVLGLPCLFVQELLRTHVLDIIIVTQNNHLEPNFQQNRKLSNLYFYVNSRHDSKRKLLFGELEAVKECGWGFGRLLGGQAGQTKQYFKVKLREFSLFDLVSLVKVLQKSN